jgi:hypothetical protein
MEPTQSSETSAYNIQTPGKFPEDDTLQSQHGESLRTAKFLSISLLRPALCSEPNSGTKKNWVFGKLRT